MDIGKVSSDFTSRTCSALFSESGNVFFSPWSLYDALALTYMGARNNTASQLSALLGYDNFGQIHKGEKSETQRNASISTAMKKMIQSLSLVKCRGTDFTTSNKLWTQNGFSLLDSFTETLQNDFQSSPGSVNFASAPEEARQTINNSVEEDTNGRITNLIPPGMVDETTKLVLTNAVYFKGSWLHEFQKNASKVMPFQVNNEKTVNAKMMYMKAVNFARYHETNDYQVLGLPYEGDRLLMTIVLPKMIDGGIVHLLEKVKNDNSFIQNGISAPCSKRPIAIYLPKFKVEFFKEFTKLLCSLGASDMFHEFLADFSGISKEESLMVTSVVHKAFVAIDEKGTEAAAATAVTFAPRSLPMRPVEPILFQADHPFLFFIADTTTKMVLFAGKLENPNS
eukprot:gene16246-17885_t